MKNIHLIATDKPTGIFQSNSGLQFSIRDKVRVEPLKGFHIYITSDEDIKEGAWRCDIELNRIEKGKETGTFKNWKKIILTTDQDLIKDGVRAIGDDFLEWFVKNPSCEFVEVESIPNNNWGFDLEEPMTLGYKIIIPQEQPKQDTVGKEFYESADKTITVYREETLKEAAENNYPDGDVWTIEQALIRRLAFINGAKWQAERMYSDEEEVYNLLENAMKVAYDFELEGHYDGDYRNLKDWFEQFKKK
jgi:hypothetical protein